MLEKQILNSYNKRRIDRLTIKSQGLRRGTLITTTLLYEKVTVVAKGKYEKWLEPENLILIDGWARDGLTDEQIAKNMGISYSTLKDWKNKYSAISAALKKGKEVVDYQVENALLLSALDGNTTAQIFWLKNRRPDKWRDKQKDDTDKNITVVLNNSEEFAK